MQLQNVPNSADALTDSDSFLPIYAIPTIQEYVAYCFGISRDILLSDMISDHIAIPRQIAMWMVTQHVRDGNGNKITVTRIGKNFDNRQTTSAQSALTTFRNNCRKDKAFEQRVQRVNEYFDMWLTDIDQFPHPIVISGVIAPDKLRLLRAYVGTHFEPVDANEVPLLNRFRAAQTLAQANHAYAAQAEKLKAGFIENLAAQTSAANPRRPADSIGDLTSAANVTLSNKAATC